MDANEPKGWQRTVPSIIAAGECLKEKRGVYDVAEFQEFARSEYMVDVSTAHKLQRIADNPVISDPANTDRLPPEWGKLYELSHLPNETLIKLIEDRSVFHITKYDIWAMRSESRRPAKNKLVPPPGLTIAEWAHQGLQLEQEKGLPPEAAAKSLGMGRKSYAIIRPILILLERSDLPEADVDSLKQVMAAIEAHRVVTLPEIRGVQPILEKFWQSDDRGRRHVRQGDKAETKRKEAFLRAIVVICDTCNNGADINIPFLSKEEVASAINKLHTAKASLVKLNRKLWRQANG